MTMGNFRLEMPTFNDDNRKNFFFYQSETKILGINN